MEQQFSINAFYKKIGAQTIRRPINAAPKRYRAQTLRRPNVTIGGAQTASPKRQRPTDRVPPEDPTSLIKSFSWSDYEKKTYKYFEKYIIKKPKNIKTIIIVTKKLIKIEKIQKRFTWHWHHL